MKNWKIFLLLLAYTLTTWYLIASGQARYFSRKGPLDIQTLDGKFNPTEKAAIFNNQALESPQLARKDILPVLGYTDSLKRIEIDLTNQRLYAYEGNNKIYDFLISSGKWGRTPTGTFHIWIKLRYTKMEGGSKALNTYYYLPNVPYVMYFNNSQIPRWRGYGIHGTYWHENFGHPMSHGCINMKTEEAGLLYHWAQPDLQGKNSIKTTADNPGTPVIIYGEALWE